MKTWIALMFEFVITVGLADFVAGFVHWFEDACVREDTPLIGAAVGRPCKQSLAAPAPNPHVDPK